MDAAVFHGMDCSGLHTHTERQRGTRHWEVCLLCSGIVIVVLIVSLIVIGIVIVRLIVLRALLPPLHVLRALLVSLHVLRALPVSLHVLSLILAFHDLRDLGIRRQLCG